MTLAKRTLESTPDPIYQSRVDLAAAHRLANKFGFDDGIHNHFTLVMPGATDQFLVKTHGLLMSGITENNLIVVDTLGNVIQGSGTIERSAFCIHAAIHIRHPAAKCVLHAHPPYSTWLADVEDGRLRMTNQDIIRFHDRVAYDDGYEGADNEVGEQFATSAVLYFDALKRELDREDPGYTA